MKRMIWRALGTLLAVVFAGLIAIPQSAQAAPAAPDCSIVYQFADGQTYTVNSAVAMTLMMTNVDGSYYMDPATGYYVVDPNKLLIFLNALQAMYPQESYACDFWGTTDGLIQFAASTANTYTKRYLNVAREMSYLPQAIMAGTKGVHQPEMSVGNTYVEVDISAQHLYYYENLALRFESDIVTGSVAGKHNTPTGVYYLRARQTNQLLTGKNYASHVDYWMPYIGNAIGLHDASWRSRFGGQIYQSNGSHGCVNMPSTKAAALYNMIQVGTPIVVHQ